MANEGVIIPRATYRVQLHAGFGFNDAAAMAPYLAALGVSHIYCSPYLQAAPGSTHGYDVIDHTQVNSELGGAEAHATFCRTLGENRLGQILDIVPNHMSIAHRTNKWWWDVMENGPSSRYASYFDVDWDPPEVKLRNNLLLPILGSHYGRALENGELRVVRDKGSFTIRYFDHTTPVAPRSLDNILSVAANRCGSDTLGFLADSYGKLPLATATDRESISRRHRDKEVLRAQLELLCEAQPEVATAIDLVLAEINTDFELLDTFLERQNYRLANWRTAGQELGYRRFFDINTLVGLRTDDEAVFRDTHALILQWTRDGVVDGLRIDHPDGLSDPSHYLTRLRESAQHCYVVVEKILEPGEHLPSDWPVQGTTGYDFIHLTNGLFVDPRGEEPLSQCYHEFTGDMTAYSDVVYEKKHRVVRDILGSDVNRLVALLVDICERHRRYRDYTRRELNHVVREIVACFPVYRSYVQATSSSVSESDARNIEAAVASAREKRTDLDADLFDFLRDLLLLRVTGSLETDFVSRFQQLTGPVMAKGVEDTAFYNYARLISLNEVGDDPGIFGVSVAEFHAECARTQTHWPHTMLAGSTHDTKRSEDVRARISLLSETPDEWRSAIGRWTKLLSGHWNGEADRKFEYFFYQTLVGAWPLEPDRAWNYFLKAAREAKAQTTWTDNNAEYEQKIEGFVRGALADTAFIQDFEKFLAPLIYPARVHSLAQTLIRLTAPGVPDIYQGTELWNLSLVDPDNRRPVDYVERFALLTKLEDATPSAVLREMENGLPKLWVVRQALAMRKQFPASFGAESNYVPLLVNGAKAEHVVAFSRGESIVTVVPRLVRSRGNSWENTRVALPAGTWRNAFGDSMFSGGDVNVETLFADFPVALLNRT